MDGNIGCMVNGAGLAMATMDIIKPLWRRASQFPRYRRRARADQVATALRLIPSDPKVGRFNIFVGITRGDEAARGF